jgi:beta-xylosidase
MKKLLMAALAVFSQVSAAKALELTHSNPLAFEYSEGQTEPRREVRDPCVIREGGTYYLVFTMHPFANREDDRISLPNNGSSPGIAMYSSKNLKDWKFETWLVKSADLPESSPYKHRFWAPEIHEINGRFYLIFTADNWLKPEYNPAGNWGTAGYAFVGVADKVTGPYKHITYIDGAACDTSLFADTDGKTYAVIPRYNIDIQPIDLTRLEQDKVELLGKPTTILSPNQRDIGFDVAADYLEGPWMEKINGVYTLFYAEIFREGAPKEWQGYWMGVATSQNISEPFKKDPRGKIFLGGHVAIFNGPDGKPWVSYRNEDPDSPSRALLCVDPLRLDEKTGQYSVIPSLGGKK